MHEIIKYIAVFFVVTLIVVAAIIGWMVSSEPKKTSVAVTDTNSPIPLTSGLLESCQQKPCAAGFTCDGLSFLCKKSEGGFCDEYAECASGLYCSGVCVQGPHGTLNEYCPCNPGYLCMGLSGPQYPTVCKGSGTPCTNDFECASLNCSFGVCETGYPLAYPCLSDHECASRNCSLGYCQPVEFTTGNLGASCAGSCVGYVGAPCRGAAGTNLGCACQTGGYPGICITQNTGLLSTCSSNFLCNSTYVCYNNGTGPTACSGSNCVCRFPYQNPNVLAPGGQCAGGMVNNGGICENGARYGCDNAVQCAGSLSCKGGPSLMYYSFTGPGPSFLSTPQVNLNVESISLLGFTGSSSTFSPKKTFPGPELDSFYVVDANYGLLYYNGEWSQVLSNSVYGPIIDASFRMFDIQYSFVAVQQGSYSVVYATAGNFSTTMVPFNVQAGSGPSGTQYDTMGNALDIDYISVSNGYASLFNYSIAIVSNGSVYVKPPTATNYSVGIIQGGRYSGSPMSNTTGPAFFYYDVQGDESNNLSFVMPWNIAGNGNPRLIQFSGPGGAGPPGTQYAIPIDNFMAPGTIYGELYYQVINYSLYPGNSFSETVMTILAAAYNASDDSFSHYTVVLFNNLLYTYFPYQVSPTFVPATTQQNYYMLSVGSCA